VARLTHRSTSCCYGIQSTQFAAVEEINGEARDELNAKAHSSAVVDIAPNPKNAKNAAATLVMTSAPPLGMKGDQPSNLLSQVRQKVVVRG
jgi:hypothetical protein